jgi:hypothetical protein
MAYTKTQSGLLVPNGTPVNVRRVRAKYDAAQTTSDNTRHWANADVLALMLHSVLPYSLVRAILMIMVDIGIDHILQMCLTKNNHFIETLGFYAPPTSRSSQKTSPNGLPKNQPNDELKTSCVYAAD